MHLIADPHGMKWKEWSQCQLSPSLSFWPVPWRLNTHNVPFLYELLLRPSEIKEEIDIAEHSKNGISKIRNHLENSSTIVLASLNY